MKWLSGMHPVIKTFLALFLAYMIACALKKDR